MDKHTVGPFPTTAHAFLGAANVFHTFRMNPDAVNWSYNENTVSQDTIGGRVVQLLSVTVNEMTVEGRAGSRGELQRMAENVRQIMQYHIRTQRPVNFRVPSRDWDFKVYVTAMPQIGWEVASTSYPFQLNLSIQEDLTGVQSHRLQETAFSRLAEGIGYNPGVHGGDAATIVEMVKTLTAVESQGTGGGGTDGETSAGDTSPGTGTSPPAPGSTTRAIDIIWKEVHAKFPRVGSAGTYVCKPIQGSSTWSQHSWGNAWDITYPGGLSDGPTAQKFLDEVAHWIEANTVKSQGGGGGLNLPVAQIIWRGWEQLHGGTVYNHTNHIHVSGNPMFSGTPPCA